MIPGVRVKAFDSGGSLVINPNSLAKIECLDPGESR
jgi:hypothetical protein